VELLQRLNPNKDVEETTELSEEVLLSTPSSSNVLTLKSPIKGSKRFAQSCKTGNGMTQI
jgi:hypothetical protein